MSLKVSVNFISFFWLNVLNFDKLNFLFVSESFKF